MAFDGITTKKIADELQVLSGARIDKVFQPNKNEIILGLYINGVNYALEMCIDSGNYRINLTTHSKSNPQVAPNFCMLLRKHLIGLKLKNIITFGLERLVILDIEGFDEFEDVVSKKLIIELMGKHSNIILVNESNIIIDSMRHIKSDDEVNRSILPHIKYQFPTTSKIDFLSLNNFTDFKKNLQDYNISNLSSLICDTYNGISKSFIDNLIISIADESKDIDKVLEKIYNYISKALETTENTHFDVVEKEINKKIKKDYFLQLGSNSSTPFSLNFFIDDFYYSKETNDSFKAYRDTTLKLILGILKKYNTRLINIDSKLKECENMDIYKLYGELITANLYKIENKNLEYVELENYYDNNKLIKIPLDKKYLPSINAKRFYKKYNKLKNTLEIVGIQKQETIKELDYLESIVYELESATTIDEVAQIFDEISENVMIKDTISKNQKKIKVKKSKLTKNKEVAFNPIKYTFEGYTIFVGRNNKENDYLTLKYANKMDYWFHTKDIHGSHVILKCTENIIPTDYILYKCAEFAAKHSKAKNSSNVPVDYCLVKYVKKPNGAKPGMVIYTNNKTIFVK
ncbi:MAG: NFACT family protein [Clostridia bacterium]|nr:NFACT family protein [Clostridia bacterium]